MAPSFAKKDCQKPNTGRGRPRADVYPRFIPSPHCDGGGVAKGREMGELSVAAAESCATGRRRVVLVVDDSAMQRRLLAAMLRQWGYQVLEAGNGEAALALCTRHADIDIVLSDWVMPGISGPEFCANFRQLPDRGYGYFILLTSRSDKGAVAEGLDVGADDFLVKPVNTTELRARLTAGERILRMQEQLEERNRRLSRTLGELRNLYETVERDLAEARKLQLSLTPQSDFRYPGTRVSLFVRPSGHVGGDLVSVVPADDGTVGLAAVDVSGHGVSAAMMAARLAGLFSPGNPEANVALEQAEGGGHGLRPLAAVAETLNQRHCADIDTGHYFTMALASLDPASGLVRLLLAGHPRPVLLKACGRTAHLGTGGLPVGLIPGAAYQDFAARLSAGDRLLLYSDGFIEIPDAGGQLLEDEDFARLLARHAGLSGRAMLDAVVADLEERAGPGGFPDDLSAVLVEYDGPP